MSTAGQEMASNSTKLESTPKPLEVRILRVLQGNGSEERFASVFCQIRGHSLTLEECTSCERCSGLYFDRSERRSRVLCNGHPEHGLPASAIPADSGRDDVCTPNLTPVSAVMAPEVVCVRPDLSVEALTTLLLERNISGVPVVDAEGKPIGVVSKTDLLRSDYEAAGTQQVEHFHRRSSSLGARGYSSDVERELGPGFHACSVARGTVNDIMTPLVFSLPENASMAQAAALMAYEGVHRIPVISTTGQVVGLLSSLDVLRWIGRRSGYFVPGTTQLQR